MMQYTIVAKFTDEKRDTFALNVISFKLADAIDAAKALAASDSFKEVYITERVSNETKVIWEAD